MGEESKECDDDGNRVEQLHLCQIGVWRIVPMFCAQGRMELMGIMAVLRMHHQNDVWYDFISSSDTGNLQ